MAEPLMSTGSAPALAWRLVSADRLADVEADTALDVYNKCLDCCPVIGCDTCGSCDLHPVSDGGIVERAASEKD